MDNVMSRLDVIIGLMCLQKKVLSLSETALYMCVSKQYLYTLTAARKIPFYRQGKFIYFRRDELEQYLLQNPVATQNEIESNAFKILNKSKNK